MVYGFNLWKNIWSFIRRFDMTDSALIIYLDYSIITTEITLQRSLTMA